MPDPMLEQLFVTQIYRAPLSDDHGVDQNTSLMAAIDVLAVDDAAGLAWSEANDYAGYTSYASLNDLPWRMPEFRRLVDAIDRHVAAFAEQLDFDLGTGRLVLDSLWVNVLAPGGHHSAHIHPHAAISGTYYVSVPEGAAAIRFEDPRHAMMMAAPMRKATARRHNQPFISLTPVAGELLLWESWLRHDVPVNHADDERVSISFNYAHIDRREHETRTEVDDAG